MLTLTHTHTLIKPDWLIKLHSIQTLARLWSDDDEGDDDDLHHFWTSWLLHCFLNSSHHFFSTHSRQSVLSITTTWCNHLSKILTSFSDFPWTFTQLLTLLPSAITAVKPSWPVGAPPLFFIGIMSSSFLFFPQYLAASLGTARTKLPILLSTAPFLFIFNLHSNLTSLISILRTSVLCLRNK